MNTELISRYIQAELSDAEKADFESRLHTDPALKQAYLHQVQLIEGIRRQGLKDQWGKSFRKVKTRKAFTKAVIATAVVLAALGTFLLIKHLTGCPTDEIRYELNETGDASWSTADRQLPSQLFCINPDRDTIIETKQGIVIAIEAGSFEHAGGEGISGSFDFEVKEALDAASIMTAGLDTRSQGKLLETGGMFYINARQGDENLKISLNKTLNVNLPVNNDKNDMMLFAGKRLPDGGIDWVDPKPMKRRLATVDITSLQFYPEHFLDTLHSMGYDIRNKSLTDSIYYSFGGCGYSTADSSYAYAFDDAVPAPKRSVSPKPDGKSLFRHNCAVCHSLTDQKLTGPGLQGITDRVPKGDWLRRYILNNEKLLKDGDAYANKIYLENGKAAMTVFEGQLSDSDVNALIRYITGRSPLRVERPLNSGCAEISPSRIHAIWDPSFNQTILATKAFEERLQTIFKTCDPLFLSLYVDNLDHDLHEIDSTAATLCGGELREAFLRFAGRRDGGVDISQAQSQRLQRYFEEKQAVYTQACAQAMKTLLETESSLSVQALEKREKQKTLQALRSSATFHEELELNLDEAYRKLGKTRTPPAANYASANVGRTGWNNVDRYVLESTISRSTLDYTDPENGKKAVIRYEAIGVDVTDAGNYDRVVCYLIPDKLSSFQLMARNGNRFNEKLNELIGYSAVAIGFKGKQTYFGEVAHPKAQSYQLKLEAIDEDALARRLNRSFPLNLGHDLLDDISFQQFDLGEIHRQQEVLKREEIQARLTRIIYPCSNIYSEYAFDTSAKAMK